MRECGIDSEEKGVGKEGEGLISDIPQDSKI
jgi:hypothetical protein